VWGSAAGEPAKIGDISFVHGILRGSFGSGVIEIAVYLFLALSTNENQVSITEQRALVRRETLDL